MHSILRTGHTNFRSEELPDAGRQLSGRFELALADWVLADPSGAPRRRSGVLGLHRYGGHPRRKSPAGEMLDSHRVASAPHSLLLPRKQIPIHIQKQKRTRRRDPKQEENDQHHELHHFALRLKFSQQFGDIA
jgi:hypothetical protein